MKFKVYREFMKTEKVELLATFDNYKEAIHFMTDLYDNDRKTNTCGNYYSMEKDTEGEEDEDD